MNTENEPKINVDDTPTVADLLKSNEPPPIPIPTLNTTIPTNKKNTLNSIVSILIVSILAITLSTLSVFITVFQQQEAKKTVQQIITITKNNTDLNKKLDNKIQNATKETNEIKTRDQIATINSDIISIQTSIQTIQTYNTSNLNTSLNSIQETDNKLKTLAANTTTQNIKVENQINELKNQVQNLTKLTQQSTDTITNLITQLNRQNERQHVIEAIIKNQETNLKNIKETLDIKKNQ